MLMHLLILSYALQPKISKIRLSVKKLNKKLLSNVIIHY